jgi:hypothetical protein
MNDTNDRQIIVAAMRIEGERPSITRRMALEGELSALADRSGSFLPRAFLRRLRVRVISPSWLIAHSGPTVAGPEAKA